MFKYDNNMQAICTNNYHWFGTIGKEYEILNIKEKTIKEIRHSNDDFTFTVYTVIDDCNQEVDISSNMFILKR